MRRSSRKDWSWYKTLVAVSKNWQTVSAPPHNSTPTPTLWCCGWHTRMSHAPNKPTAVWFAGCLLAGGVPMHLNRRQASPRARQPPPARPLLRARSRYSHGLCPCKHTHAHCAQDLSTPMRATHGTPQRASLHPRPGAPRRTLPCWRPSLPPRLPPAAPARRARAPAPWPTAPAPSAAAHVRTRTTATMGRTSRACTPPH
mmetsp:Transcript_2008/g.5276  ORF Transcript_2008/g.5276 Transcript_2008/m.5276 type:complete len:200 (-) Transcript_2008:882-1481(-)